MLDFLRRSASSIVVKALLVLLIVSFGAWGIGDVFRNTGSGNAVATVGETEIPLAEFRAEFAREVDRLRNQLGPQMSREQALAMGLDGMVLQRMVNMQLIQVGADDLGLMASDAVVAADIKQTRDFYNASGQFDRRVYQNLLSRAGLSEDMYAQRVRQGIVRQQMLGPINRSALVPAPLADRLFTRLAERRVLDVVRINHDAVTDVPAPSDADLRTYHDENRRRFMAPEYRDITAVVLSTDDVADTIDVSEEELRAAYDARADQFVKPETRTLRQVLVRDEAAARRAVEMLDAGESLADVVAEVGANPAMTDLGVFTHGDAAQLSPDLAEAVFSTPRGGHTQPVKSPLGWHVLQVDDIQPGSARDLADVRDQVLADVRAERALDVLFELSNELEDMLGGGQTLEEAASALNVELVEAPAVDKSAMTPAGEPATIPYATDLVNTAFTLEEGRDSLLTESEDGQAFYVVRVDGVTPPALKPLDQVREQVETLWTAEQRAAKAAERAETAKSRLEAGHDPADVAEAVGGQAFTTDPFNRTGDGLTQGALPATVMENAFGVAEGGVVAAEGTNAHTVARVKSVQAQGVDRNDPLYAQVREQVRGSLQGDLLDQMSRALQQQHPVQVNQSALNQLN